MEPRPDTAHRHEIRVTWGDCDPAKIVYTRANTVVCALDAINSWWVENLGGDGWFQMELDRNVGTPFVRLEMDFRAPITPRHPLVCHVWPVRLGETSITFRVDGMQDGTMCFSSRTVSVFIDAAAFTKRTPPDDMRAVIERLLPGVE